MTFDKRPCIFWDDASENTCFMFVWRTTDRLNNNFFWKQCRLNWNDRKLKGLTMYIFNLYSTSLLYYFTYSTFEAGEQDNVRTIRCIVPIHAVLFQKLIQNPKGNNQVLLTKCQWTIHGFIGFNTYPSLCKNNLKSEHKHFFNAFCLSSRPFLIPNKLN